MPRLDGLKFHRGKPGSCNHHLRAPSKQTKKIYYKVSKEKDQMIF